MTERSTTRDAMATPDRGEPELVIRATPADVSTVAAERIADGLVEAVERRGIAHFNTTGGSTPIGIYEALGVPPLRERVPWDRIHVWWGDDRFVPRDHPESNVRSLEDVLLRQAALSGESGQGDYGADAVEGILPGAPLPTQNIHRWPTTEAIASGRDNEWCARQYAEMTRGLVPMNDAGWPVFDVVLVGIGDDGHVLSVFPGSAALDSDALTMGIPAPTHIEPHLPRVTFNPRMLDAAPILLAVTSGSVKAPVLGEIFGPIRDDRRWPSQRTRRTGATWIIDEAAAARLPEDARRRAG